MLTGACQFGHGVGGVTTNFIHSEPPDKEVLKNSPFSRGEWPVETDIDVGFDGVYQVSDTPANAGLRSVTSKRLLALAYASGQHDELLAMIRRVFFGDGRA